MARKRTTLSRAAQAAWASVTRLAVWIGWRRGVVGALLLLGPVVGVNVLVARCGSSVVFPLSPFYLRAKVLALSRYAAHRPHCFIDGHPPLGPVIVQAEARHRLPRGLLAALIQVESEGRPHRISPTGAMGPGQLMPSTARALGVDDPFDTADNVDGSARYLAQQVARFRDLRLAVAAYNAGPGAVAASHGVPHNGETEVYVERVFRLRRATAAPVVVRGQPPRATPSPAPGPASEPSPSSPPPPPPHPHPRFASDTSPAKPQAAERHKPRRVGTGPRAPGRHRAKRRAAHPANPASEGVRPRDPAIGGRPVRGQTPHGPDGGP